MSYAYTLAFYTDESPPTKAEEYIKNFKNTPPFNEFDINFIIVKKSKDYLGCYAKKYYYKNQGTTRSILTCDSKKIKRDAASKGYDHSIIVSDDVKNASANADSYFGKVARVHTHSSNATCQHEFLHLLGFADEYYCPSRERKALNLAYIKPQNPYSSDKVARTKHGKNISWYGRIKGSTLITSSESLGTPVEFNKELGLFRLHSCTIGNSIQVWKPGKYTIMQSLTGSLSVYSPLIKQALSSLGIKHNPNKKAEEEQKKKEEEKRKLEEQKKKEEEKRKLEEQKKKEEEKRKLEEQKKKEEEKRKLEEQKKKEEEKRKLEEQKKKEEEEKASQQSGPKINTPSSSDAKSSVSTSDDSKPKETTSQDSKPKETVSEESKEITSQEVDNGRFNWMILLAASIGSTDIIQPCSNCDDVWVFTDSTVAWLVGEIVATYEFKENINQVKAQMEIEQSKQLGAFKGAYLYSKARAKQAKVKQQLATDLASGLNIATGVAIKRFLEKRKDESYQNCEGFRISYNTPESTLQKIIHQTQSILIPSLIAASSDSSDFKKNIIRSILNIDNTDQNTLAGIVNFINVTSKDIFKVFRTPFERIIIYDSLMNIAQGVAGEMGNLASNLEKNASIYKELHDALEKEIKGNRGVRNDSNKKKIDREVIYSDVVTEIASSAKSTPPHCVMVDESYRVFPDPKCRCNPNCDRKPFKSLVKNLSKNNKRIKMPRIYKENIARRHRGTQRIANGHLQEGLRTISMENHASAIKQTTDNLKEIVNKKRRKKRKQSIPFNKLAKLNSSSILENIKRRFSRLSNTRKKSLVNLGFLSSTPQEAQAKSFPVDQIEKNKKISPLALGSKRKSNIRSSVPSIPLREESLEDIYRSIGDVSGSIDDISQNKNQSIFKLISRRYLISVYPILVK